MRFEFDIHNVPRTKPRKYISFIIVNSSTTRHVNMTDVDNLCSTPMTEKDLDKKVDAVNRCEQAVKSAFGLLHDLAANFPEIKQTAQLVDTLVQNMIDAHGAYSETLLVLFLQHIRAHQNTARYRPVSVVQNSVQIAFQVSAPQPHTPQFFAWMVEPPQPLGASASQPPTPQFVSSSAPHTSVSQLHTSASQLHTPQFFAWMVDPN